MLLSEEIIRLLAPDVIDKIAAGEVVDRPAAVVKELVENAVDAGARNIQVELNGGGSERILVSDDGCGMSAADAPRALISHATSKLQSAEELFAIATLGFRGEALSSIAAVSRLTLTTRRPKDAAGTRIRAEGGQVLLVEATGAPIGTSLEVRDLFFNTPARRKFLRSPATEQAHCVDAVARVILGARQGGVLVRAGERRLLDLPGEADEATRTCLAISGGVDRLFPLHGRHDGVRVSGWLARPEVGRADSRGMWFFVNHRFVRDRMLQRALLDGHRTLLSRGRYPIAVVHLEVDAAAVDVNVHPQKTEVRFADAQAVFRALSQSVATALAGTIQLGLTGYRERTLSALQRFAHSEANEPRPHVYNVSEPTDAALAAAAGPFSALRPVGQVLGVYLVCEGADELVLIDQHAAAERVVFERLRRQAEGAGIERQTLLFPEPLQLSPHHAEVLEQQAARVGALGFDIELVGPSRAMVRAVPAALSRVDAKQLADDLIAALAEPGGAALPTTELRDHLLARLSCHAAVRAGDRLSIPEIQALLIELDHTERGAHCPHGRPVMHTWPKSELDRLFHRT